MALGGHLHLLGDRGRDGNNRETPRDDREDHEVDSERGKCPLSAGHRMHDRTVCPSEDEERRDQEHGRDQQAQCLLHSSGHGILLSAFYFQTKPQPTG